MKFRCSVLSVDEAVDFYSDGNLFDLLNKPSLLGDHIDFTVSDQPANSGYKIFYTNGYDNSVTYSRKQCHINYPWEQMNNGETLLYSTYPLLETQRQRNACVTAYSAAVSLNNDGLLLLGKSGAGKTSVAVDLCRRYGAQLVGNDLTILGLQEDSLFVKGGTKFFLLRFESIRKSLPDLISLFPNQAQESWLYKIKVEPEKLRIITRSHPVKIKRVFSLHVDEGLSSLHVQNDQNLATKLFLIENFSRYIKGSCVNILGGEKFNQLNFVPSYDTEIFFNFRRSLIDIIESKIKYISGPLNLVTDYIANNNS